MLRSLLPSLALLVPSPAARPAAAAPAAAAAPLAAESAFEVALREGESALAKGDAAFARSWAERALERDGRSVAAWALRARCAAALGDRDGQVYALHRRYRLAVAQKLPREELEALRAELVEVDPIAEDLLGLSQIFVARLVEVAAQYEKDQRPHSAIRVHKEILALDAENAASRDAIQRLASRPDPSLAGDAKPRDLLEGVSTEWIEKHDAKHREWKDRAKLERDHYVTHTNSGYANLVRAAEAMEQMNAFYRQFFEFGTEDDGRAVPRIDLVIFRTRDEYLKLGSGPPAEWSGGQFTGGSVETYVGEGSFEDMIGTLFHEAAHQFVSLATNASGWLNEGLASFFEGCRILSNGTVLMNMPANHRLFPMVERLRVGWMSDENDGIDPKEPAKSSPKEAPTFRIVLENRYTWGPPWYAPTWAVVYFLYNYQDPVDGRYVYRKAFREFVDKSGGRVGEGAVGNFEEVVLANPLPPIKGVPRPKDAPEVRLPKTVAELDPVWKDWLLALADEQLGVIEVERPYLDWARFALKAKDEVAAREHFEKALVAAPQDPDTLLEFAAFLSERKGADRASRLALEALRTLESAPKPDAKAVAAAERLLEKADPRRKALATVHEELWAAARNVVQRYLAGGTPTMVMDLAWHMAADLNAPGMLELYETAVRQGGKTLEPWQLAYNERDLTGWAVPGETSYAAKGDSIEVSFGDYDEKRFDYQILTYDTVTSGDYSFEAAVQAPRGEVVFCGLVFGRKDANNFHGLILFPGKTDASGSREGLADAAFVDIASSFGGTSFRTWRHNPVRAEEKPADDDRTRVARWRKLRIDVTGATVDAWFDGELVASQEFPSADVLRGGFGLICGPGRARFGEVRYLARSPGDPAARIDRRLRVESIEQAGESVGGSWLGRVPPFPKVEKWLQGERKTWREKGPVPQLLVLWSTQQNDLVPIDEWLTGLAQQHAAIGLEVVAIASPNDSAAAAAYLAEHPLPGAVGVDFRDQPGIGETFERYAVDRFNLPRLVLIDIDGKVAWEGDPGFSRGDGWSPGGSSYLDAPLAELIERRRLEALSAWRAKWLSTGAPALAQGDLAAALPLMREARTLPANAVDEVDAATAKLAALEGAFEALQTTAASFAREGVEPALPELARYAAVLGAKVDKNTQVVLRAHADGKNAKEWARALELCGRLAAHKKKDERLGLAQELVARLATMGGRFARELHADLAAAVEAGDVERAVAVAAAAGERPRAWLLADYLGWREPAD